MNTAKYQEVLRPLKHIQEVWGIDLASVLQQYAADIAQITVDVGGHALNFAEAAILIMSASALYGKKVDALQALVQEAYDMIINKKPSKEGHDSKESKKRKRRVVVRQTIRFADDAIGIGKSQSLYRQDVAETLRLMTSGSDVPGTALTQGLSRDSARVAEGELVPLENTTTGGFNFRVNTCTISSEGLLLPNVRQELMGNIVWDASNPDSTTPMHPGALPRTPGSGVPQHMLDLVKQAERKKLEDEWGSEGSDQDDAESNTNSDQGTQEEEEHAAPLQDRYAELLRLCAQNRFSVTIPNRAYERLVLQEKTAAAEPTKQVLAELSSEKLSSLGQNAKEVLKSDASGGIEWNIDKLGKAQPPRTKGLDQWKALAKEALRRDLLAERAKALAVQAVTPGPVAGPEIPVHQVPEQLEPVLPEPVVSCGDAGGSVDEGPNDFDDDLELGLSQTQDLHDPFLELEVKVDMPTTIASREEEERYERVQRWREVTEAKLHAQEQLPVFDIHVDAKKLVDSFESEGESVEFGDLVQRCCTHQWEIPRLFLAMLQLTNTQNIDLKIHHMHDGKVSDNITLKHISSESVFNFDEQPQPEEPRQPMNKRQRKK